MFPAAMLENLHDDAPSPQVKNTFLTFEDDNQENSMNTLKRQQSAPAPSMQHQVSVSSQIDSYPMFMKADLKTIKLLSPSTGFCDEPRFSRQVSDNEPEGEPSSFSRQVSSAFSDDEFCGGVCRQETDQAWPTWVARPQIDPLLAAPLVNPQVHWLSAATLHIVPPPPMLPATPPDCSAPLPLGIASTTSQGTKFEVLAVDETNHEEAQPTSKNSKGLSRSRRKNKSLITLAHKAQQRQPQTRTRHRVATFAHIVAEDFKQVSSFVCIVGHQSLQCTTA